MKKNKIALGIEIITIPLNQLDNDPMNVRRTDILAGIPELADDIAAHGLLQNLGVRPALDEAGQETGRYFVAFGGRRLAALRHLADSKRLANDVRIPCRLFKESETTSASLAENLSRIAMHPIDAFVAFADLIEQGNSEDAVAVRFGVSVQTVRRRMRLGRLSPIVIAGFKSGDISEEVAKAFAITTDHASQERVFNELGDRICDVYAGTVKRLLTEGELPANDFRVRYVGIEEYERAGGKVRRDLFSEGDHGATLLDAALLNGLAIAKLQSEADTVRLEGWSRVLVDVEKPDVTGYVAVDLPDCASGDDSIGDAAPSFDAAKLESGVALVYLSSWGEPRIERLVPQAFRDVDTAQPLAPTPFEHGFSNALMQSLLAHRTTALQAHVAQNPALAIRLLAQSMILSFQTPYRNAVSVMKLGISRPDTLPLSLDAEMASSVGRRIIDTLNEQRGEREPGDAADLLPWLLAMSDNEVIDLLAPLLAMSVDAGRDDWGQSARQTLAAQASLLSGFDMHSYWKPESENFFSRITKEQIVKTMVDIDCSISTIGRKSDLIAQASSKIEGSGWLPSIFCLRDLREVSEQRLAA